MPESGLCSVTSGSGGSIYCDFITETSLSRDFCEMVMFPYDIAQNAQVKLSTLDCQDKVLFLFLTQNK